MPHLLRLLQCCPLVSDNISLKCLSLIVKESEKLMLDPHPDPNQHQHLITSRGLTLAHPYRVWSTFVNAFVSYPARSKTNERLNELTHHSANLNGVIRELRTTSGHLTATQQHVCEGLARPASSCGRVDGQWDHGTNTRTTEMWRKTIRDELSKIVSHQLIQIMK